MTGARLNLVDVGKRFGLTRVLSKVNTVLEPGRITAFVGPNGAGKTTLFGAICGEIRPIEGRVELNGRDLSMLSSDCIARSGIGRMFQDVRVFRNATVRDNVAMALLPQEVCTACGSLLRAIKPVIQARCVADEILNRVGLIDRADDRAESLSWGNQKLLAFARLLACRPSVLLLDEPLSGISPTLAERMKVMIRQQAREQGITIGLVEHDMKFISELADWIVVMDDGCVLDQGPPSSILQRPQFVELLVGL